MRVGVLDLPSRVAESLVGLVYEQRAVAYLLVDPALRLAGAGGSVEHYGLGDLELGRPVCDQVLCLEGLLPVTSPLDVVPSVQMPSGRVADLHFHADAEGSTWIVLLDVTTEHDAARRVQQKAYDMTLLSEREARLIAQLRAAHRELEASQAALLRTNLRLEAELREAERYVRSILPPPFTEPFVADWRFVPSTELGGDSFGYQWLDAEHFAFYLLDVCGHGVGAALLSVAVVNTLRSEALPGTDFHDPGAVLSALNEAYQMERHDNLFFTIWYGVWEPATRTVRYASAGHPPALLVDDAAGEPRTIERLHSDGPSLGIAPALTYQTCERRVPAPSRLFLFSDGAFEIREPDGAMLAFEAFVEVLARPVTNGESELDRVLDLARTLHGAGALDDDLSIVKLAL